jgi:activating signal cointegrator complex subunit 1
MLFNHINVATLIYKAEAQVLYITPQDESQNKVLSELCKALIDKMVEGGFMQKEDRPLKVK